MSKRLQANGSADPCPHPRNHTRGLLLNMFLWLLGLKSKAPRSKTMIPVASVSVVVVVATAEDEGVHRQLGARVRYEAPVMYV